MNNACIKLGYMTVATSIAPFNIEKKRKAVASWMNEGIKVPIL